MEIAKPGRPCATCTHSERAKIESALAQGEPVSRVSTLYGIAPASLYRHLRDHAGPELKQALHSSHALDADDLLSRVAEIADDARTARWAAQDAGAVREAHKAAEAELKALAVLSARFGIDAAEVHSELADREHELAALAVAVGRAARRDGTVGDAIVAQLKITGHEEIADALAGTFESRNKREVTS